MKNQLYWIPICTYFICVSLLLFWKDYNLLFSTNRIVNTSIFIGIFLGLNLIKKQINPQNFIFISIIAIYASLSLLYKETAELNLLFRPELDPWLMELDQKIFGFQPAEVFSEAFSNWWFSELMFFGYFWYYLMPLSILFIIYKKIPQKAEEFGFILIGSFLFYYLIFILLPALGPQYYFEPPKNEIISQGFFGNTVKLIQKNGEAPTAAFPSSHVGISWIVIIWIWKNIKKSLLFFLPFVLLLMCSTIYIKAHYFTDVWAGLISAFITYPIIYYFYKNLSDAYNN